MRFLALLAMLSAIELSFLNTSDSSLLKSLISIWAKTSHSPLNDTQTIFTLNYKSLSKKALPSNKCPYQKAIVLKNLQRAFNRLSVKSKDLRGCA
ncbi:hypothetical protein HpHA237_02570 [Helicobacter pylori]